MKNTTPLRRYEPVFSGLHTAAESPVIDESQCDITQSPLELLRARRAEAAKLFENMQAQSDKQGCITITLGIANIHGDIVNALTDKVIELMGGQHQTVTLDCSGISTIDVHAAHALAIRLGRESGLNQITISGANDEVAEMLEEEGFAVS